MKKTWLVSAIVLLVSIMLLGGCGPAPAPTETEPASGPARARDVAMASIWAEGEAMPAFDWREEDLTPQGLLGSSTIRYTADEWVVTVTFPIVAPEATIYQVNIVNTASGLVWDGQVDAQGNVLRADGGSQGIANPASVYCQEQGGTLEIRSGEGGEVGICVFADGSECEEWAFFRGECAP
jgi:putative hemolysin